MPNETQLTKLLKLIGEKNDLLILLNEETTMLDKLRKDGFEISRLVRFLKKSVETYRDEIETNRDSMSDDEYYEEKLTANEADMLILYLENSI